MGLNTERPYLSPNVMLVLLAVWRDDYWGLVFVFSCSSTAARSPLRAPLPVPLCACGVEPLTSRHHHVPRGQGSQGGS